MKKNKTNLLKLELIPVYQMPAVKKKDGDQLPDMGAPTDTFATIVWTNSF